jgi:hypothetical protein
MTRRMLPPKKLRLKSQIERARLLAEESPPLIAELYRVHGEICESGLNRKRRSARDRKLEPAT